MTETQSLSEREIEILSLIASGMSNRDIGETLHISPNTVKVHVRNIFAKLEVTSRTEASMLAVREGLIGTEVLPGEDPPPSGEEAGIEDETAEEAPDTPDTPPAPGVRPDIFRPTTQTWLISGLFVIVTLLTVIAFRLYQTGLEAAPTDSTDPVAVESQWTTRPSVPEPRSRAAAVTYENVIIVIGGLKGTVATGSVDRFDPENGDWVALSPKPTPVSEIQAVILGGRIYVPGGLLDDGTPSAVLEIYNPLDDSWARGPDLPVGLSGYALAAHEGKLYMFGGWDGKALSDRVFVLDPDTAVWSERTPMPVALQYSGAAVAGGRIYVIGGFDGSRASISTWLYTPALEGGSPWTAAADMPEGRYAFGLVTIADKIHLIGGLGESSEYFSQMDYAPQTDTWQVIENPLAGEWAFFSATGIGTNIFTLGGEIEGIQTNRSLSYQVLFVVVIPVIQP